VKILILKPSSLGDVIQALPVLRHLRLAYPDAEIHWWIAKGLAPLLEDDPDLDGLVPFSRAGWFRPAATGNMLGQITRLRAMEFDWVVDLQGLFRSGLFAWLTQGKCTIGLENPKEGAPAFHDISVPRPGPSSHAVDWYLAVLDRMGVPRSPEFLWLPERPGVGNRLKELWNLDGEPLVTLCPGARWRNKRWPAEHFQELVLNLSRRFGDCRFALIGGGEDQELGDQISAVCPTRCIDLTGHTSLPEMIEWIRLSSLLITNDTGPMHAGAALGTPMISLFGPTNPNHTGPYGQRGSVLQTPSLSCVPCMKPYCLRDPWMDCLKQLTPGMVAEVAVSHLAGVA